MGGQSQFVARGPSALFSATVARSSPQSSVPHSSESFPNSALPDPVEKKNGEQAAQRPQKTFRGRHVQILYGLIDICFVVFDGALAFLLRFPPPNLRTVFAPSSLVGMDNRYAGFLLLYVGLIVLFCQGQRLYRTPLELSPSAEALSVAKAVSFATLLLVAFVYLSGARIASRGVVAIGVLLNIAALSGWRYAKRRFITGRIERGVGTRNALVVGAGQLGQSLAQLLQQNKLLGYRFVGFLDANPAGDQTLGRVEDLSRVVRTEFVDEIFVTIPTEREMVKHIAFASRRHRIAVNVIPDLYDGLAWNAPLHRLGEFPVIRLQEARTPRPGRIAKRVIDICLSSIGLIFCAPLLVALTILIRWDSPGPVFYRSRRVGRKGRVFSCYKLRTMVANADDLKDSLRDRNEREGPFFKIDNDPRVTRTGTFLRRYSLDELPQLWNVFVGDMSLVGPRPHPIDDYKQYDLDHLRRLEVKPGITGLWQVTARRDPSFERGIRLDLEYIENWNLRLDFRIMLRTLASVARAEGC
jgi:exopolysaccharide biosynthesis polyprenyl glycosylphosphotransferase